MATDQVQEVVITEEGIVAQQLPYCGQVQDVPGLEGRQQVRILLPDAQLGLRCIFLDLPLHLMNMVLYCSVYVYGLCHVPITI